MPVVAPELPFRACVPVIAAALLLLALPPTAAMPVGSVVEGSAIVNRLQILSTTGIPVESAPLFAWQLACADCSVIFHATDGSLVAVGGGAAGALPTGKTYSLAGYRGHVGIHPLGGGQYHLKLDGIAGTIHSD